MKLSHHHHHHHHLCSVICQNVFGKKKQLFISVIVLNRRRILGTDKQCFLNGQRHRKISHEWINDSASRWYDMNTMNRSEPSTTSDEHSGDGWVCAVALRCNVQYNKLFTFCAFDVHQRDIYFTPSSTIYCIYIAHNICVFSSGHRWVEIDKWCQITIESVFIR